MHADVNGYSQWLAGKLNNVADALSRDWHRNKEALTFILRSHFPEQMLASFCISQNSWLISLLRQLPMSEQLREHHTTMGLKPGGDGRNIANPLNATTPSLTGSVELSEI